VGREEFSKKTKLDAFRRSDGKCEECASILRPGRFEYDHDKPAAFGGGAFISNCRVLCSGCHSRKTFGRDIPAIAKSNRVRARQAGIKKQSKFACSKASKWKKKISGEVVPR
jgi:5-methylcytosine-specific restriction endonuclease McrA